MTRFASLATERLILRRLVVTDAEAMAAYRADPELGRYQGWTPESAATLATFFAELDALEPGRPPGPWFQIAIEDRASGQLAGDCALRVRSAEPTTAEVGYTLAPGFHRRGYATEAVGALCRWALATLGLARVIATTDARNLPSIRVLERIGMIQIAAFETRFRGEDCLELTYELRSRPT